MKYWYIILPLSILIILIAFYLNNRKDVLKQYNDYNIIRKNTVINGEILKIDRVTSNTLIITKNSEKYWINTTWNISYNPSNISDFIRIGDSISKGKNNDTLFIYREKIKYFFMMNYL
jgi:hypothetical protein